MTAERGRVDTQCIASDSIFKQQSTRLRDLAARFRASFAINVPPFRKLRAQGMPGAQCAAASHAK
jgi:hypothetical protein